MFELEKHYENMRELDLEQQQFEAWQEEENKRCKEVIENIHNIFKKYQEENK